MPLISISQTPGTDPQKKAALLRAVTDAYVAATGAKPASVWATVTEVPLDNWTVGGETLADRAAKA
ncbi:4-oxalocrotonate tautomerase [Rathayibacter rathayi]|uniref:4-oxalocrotonate tautomerase n=1 Tax=Rathayibacter rathayi TaxID=33887 RepID=A0ABD6WD41_RATRA|nr:tautomerase family protein [Rathayibacter rathayi]AZZ50460.1 Tautomerase domain-containing protein [Rathayibacter rathayi]MWV73192.1 4-oxalocrotonate tautomerase [Rathayibacter rathayi NCPPB 2980 = VKM Ac-1601]PPF16455.1 4-oxalocrotonate tautomerase [Rathayibacter rathayi]PPF25689.1 4-oxalocrotonate tautomerase [Rathayibacter rathayi]PPF52048.1 4-oxalocrotonate tautomerase [Rathayibacter rathayi]